MVNFKFRGGWALTESSTLSYQPLHLTSFICSVTAVIIVFVFDVNKYYLTWLDLKFNNVTNLWHESNTDDQNIRSVSAYKHNKSKWYPKSRQPKEFCECRSYCKAGTLAPCTKPSMPCNIDQICAEFKDLMNQPSVFLAAGFLHVWRPSCHPTDSAKALTAKQSADHTQHK